MRPLPKGLVQPLGRIPGVEPHADAALAVEDSVGDELAFVREEIDGVAVGGAALDAIDRRVEHPGVSAVERPRLAGFEDDLSQGDLYERSGGEDSKSSLHDLSISRKQPEPRLTAGGMSCTMETAAAAWSGENMQNTRDFR